MAAFGRLQHSDQQVSELERRLRALPWSGERACGASYARQHPESGAHGLRPGQRHLHPVPLTRPSAHHPIEGKYYDWPVGYHVGLNLRDYWQLEDHTLGQLSFTHFPDGTAHKNRMQGNDSCRVLCIAAASPASIATMCTPRRTTRNSESREPNMPRLPRPRLAERTAHGDTGRAYTPQRRLHRQRMRGLPHAKDRGHNSRVFVSAHTFAFITRR